MKNITFSADERLIEQARQEARRKGKAGRPAPVWFDYSSAPLRLVLDAAPVSVGQHRTESSVEMLIYDFGAALLTYRIAQISFEVVPISSVTFTGPSADTLMGLINSPSLPLGFGVGLVPGVFVGAGAMALLTREWRIQRFGADTPMERYLIGATLMGFGSMLAGGCAVGAGMSGGAVFSVTAWLAVFCMWLGAMATQIALGRIGAARGQAVA